MFAYLAIYAALAGIINLAVNPAFTTQTTFPATVFLVNKPLGILSFIAAFLVFFLIYHLRGRLEVILSALQRRFLALFNR